MKITWVTKSFLDYRIPVFKELDALCNHRLNVIFSDRLTPPRVQNKMSSVLGERAHILSGEKVWGTDCQSTTMANQSIRIPFQPGLLKAIANTKPDVIIGDGFFQWTSAALFCRIWKKTPLVVCYERTFHTERKAQWFRILYRRMALHWIDAMCCNGQLCSEYTRWLGMNESGITLGHMVADIDKMQMSTEKTSPEQIQNIRAKWQCSKLAFIFVGQLVERKGIRQLLDAWNQFEKAFPRTGTLLIVGSGELESELKDSARKYGMCNVRFLGNVDYDLIASYYATADVFIMPTLEDNWSLVVPEAMACGLPVLTSKYNGCWPELVHEGENGWVFDSLDPADIFRCLKLCAENAADLETMGQKSREIVSEHSPRHAAQAVFDACAIALERVRKRS